LTASSALFSAAYADAIQTYPKQRKALRLAEHHR
jgi:hypothetical protein